MSSSVSLFLLSLANHGQPTEWNNSKKPFEKFDKSNACENSVDMLSHKLMNRKQESCRLMTRQEKEEDMVKWLAEGSSSQFDGYSALVCMALALFMGRKDITDRLRPKK